MNKVITINLNGRAYQLEEKGYELLREYLDKAAAKLHDNPDKDELMSDFEQAIADKCDARLSPRKNVMTAMEIEEIIQAMGPVDATGGTATTGVGAEDGTADSNGTGSSGTSSGGTATAPKRLFRIPRGEWITGVCNGLAAYFNVDVTLVRVIFVILGALTHGFWIAAYIVLIVVMPVARTEEDYAAAHGTKPFNAHDFIEQAKARAEEFRKEFEHHGNVPPQPETPGAEASPADWQKWKQDMKDWKRELKEKLRSERHARHAERYASRHGWQNQSWQNQPWQNRSWQDESVGGGIIFFRLLIGLIIAALWIAFIFAVWSFLAHGMILGHAIGGGHPLWVTLLFMMLIFWLILLPFKAAMWSMRYRNYGSNGWHGSCGHHHGGGFVGEIWTLAVLILLFYVASLIFPQVHGAWEHVIAYLQTVR